MENIIVWIPKQLPDVKMCGNFHPVTRVFQLENIALWIQKQLPEVKKCANFQPATDVFPLENIALWIQKLVFFLRKKSKTLCEISGGAGGKAATK